VIGAGSGGIRAARTAAALGARVGICESAALGGTCVNRGCVPKKLLVHASRHRAELADMHGYGFASADPEFDWATLIGNKDRAIARLNGLYERMLADAGVEILRGRARLVDTQTVAIAPSARRCTARHILIATGGRPVIPPIPGHEHGITSDQAFHLEHLPRRALVVGGGYIAVEFASIFHGLGAATTLVHRGPGLLRGFDDEARDFLTRALGDSGIELRFGVQVTAIERRGDDLHAQFSDGTAAAADLVLFAIGRRPDTADLGLAEVGVELDGNGAVRVDADYRSSVPSIHAVGDVTDRVRLTPVAIAEGRALAQRLFGGGEVAPVDYGCVPTAVFSTPELAAVGLTEAAARARGEVRVYRADFRPTRHLLSGRNERTFMKLVVDAGSERLLGAHMVGADAAEVIQGLAIAIKAGMTKAQLGAVIGIHPTAAEEFLTLK